MLIFKTIVYIRLLLVFNQKKVSFILFSIFIFKYKKINQSIQHIYKKNLIKEKIIELNSIQFSSNTD